MPSNIVLGTVWQMSHNISRSGVMLTTECDNCWLMAMRTPPPCVSLWSLWKRRKLGKSVRTSTSVISLVSQVSISISSLMQDNDTILDTFSRFGRKLRMLVKIAENERLSRQWQLNAVGSATALKSSY